MLSCCSNYTPRRKLRTRTRRYISVGALVGSVCSSCCDTEPFLSLTRCSVNSTPNSYDSTYLSCKPDVGATVKRPNHSTFCHLPHPHLSYSLFCPHFSPPSTCSWPSSELSVRLLFYLALSPRLPPSAILFSTPSSPQSSVMLSRPSVVPFSFRVIMVSISVVNLTFVPSAAQSPP